MCRHDRQRPTKRKNHLPSQWRLESEGMVPPIEQRNVVLDLSNAPLTMPNLLNLTHTTFHSALQARGAGRSSTWKGSRCDIPLVGSPEIGEPRAWAEIGGTTPAALRDCETIPQSR